MLARLATVVYPNTRKWKRGDLFFILNVFVVGYDAK